MTAPIEPFLHHYPGSPFAEKVRLMLGHKRLAWRSVLAPATMPKPDLVALTGGYRRIPVLQTGADVWCDTALISRVLDAFEPARPLHPAGAAAYDVVAAWADRELFGAAVACAFRPEHLPALFAGAPPEAMRALVEDRVAMAAADKAAGAAGLGRMPAPEALGALFAGLDRLDAMLADGRAFLSGDAPHAADFSAWHPLWFAGRVPALRAHVDARPAVAAWGGRVAAIGHGTSTRASADDALAAARAAGGVSRSPLPDAPVLDLHGLAVGERVVVAPLDYGIAEVEGEWVGSTVDRIALRRTDPRAGTVIVHFPRAGFRARRAG